MRKIYTLFQALFNSVPEQTAGQGYTQRPQAKAARKARMQNPQACAVLDHAQATALVWTRKSFEGPFHADHHQDHLCRGHAHPSQAPLVVPLRVGCVGA